MVAQASTGEIFRVHLNFPKVHHAVVEVHHNHPHLPPTVPQHLFRVGVAPPRNFLQWVPSWIFLPSLFFLDAPRSAETPRGQAETGPCLGPAPPALSIRAPFRVDRRTSLRERKVLGASRVTASSLGRPPLGVASAWPGVARGRLGICAPLSFHPRPLWGGQRAQPPRMD